MLAGVLLAATGVCMANGQLPASGGAGRTIELSTTITKLSRESSNSPLMISTTQGMYFTQAGIPFRTKSGEGFLIIPGDGSLEPSLLARVNQMITLIISLEVDGLVVGALFEDGSRCLEPFLIKAG